VRFALDEYPDALQLEGQEARYRRPPKDEAHFVQAFESGSTKKNSQAQRKAQIDSGDQMSKGFTAGLGLKKMTLAQGAHRVYAATSGKKKPSGGKQGHTRLIKKKKTPKRFR